MESRYHYTKKYKAKHPEKVYESKRRYYAKTAFAMNHRLRFTDEEIQMIKDHNIPDTELAKKMGRSVQAIQTKRSRLNHKGGR